MTVNPFFRTLLTEGGLNLPRIAQQNWSMKLCGALGAADFGRGSRPGRYSSEPALMLERQGSDRSPSRSEPLPTLTRKQVSDRAFVRVHPETLERTRIANRPLGYCCPLKSPDAQTISAPFAAAFASIGHGAAIAEGIEAGRSGRYAAARQAGGPLLLRSSRSR